MKKNIRVLISATALTIIGTILFLIGGVMSGFDITALSSEKESEASYEISEDFKNINIDTSTANVKLVASTDGVCRVECKETERIFHKVSVSNGTLNIILKDTRAWYEHIGLFYVNMSVTVYLPEEEYGQLNIETDTGKINVQSGFTFESATIESDTGKITCGADVKGNAFIETNTGSVSVSDVTLSHLKVSVDTGSVTISGVSADGINIESDTGGVRLENTILTGRLDIETDTGNVNVWDCDAAEIKIETDTGNVKGHFLTEKTFFAHSDTGKVVVPDTIGGGRCEITTDTGNIRFDFD